MSFLLFILLVLFLMIGIPLLRGWLYMQNLHRRVNESFRGRQQHERPRREYDEEEEDINLKSEGVYTLDGTADLEEVAEELDITLPEDSEDYDTIGGYLTSILGTIPEEDETVELDAMGYHFKILSITDHHLDEIEATRLKPDQTVENSDRTEEN